MTEKKYPYKENYPKIEPPFNLPYQGIDVYRKNYDSFIEEIIKPGYGYNDDNQWKIPKPSGSEKPQKRIEVTPPADILAPFEKVFFDSALMDELLVRCSVPELLERKAPLYPGVILFGPPGTGKSEFQSALVESYTRAGAFAEQVSASAVNSCYVGQLAKNIESKLQQAI
ncbi:MAG TPA: AAA family ATPase, partial [Candidatus Nanoarchaeia archaeon]|nr:AAA family ATPase [Candidatus Nanoarchaeia archaeon]